MSRRALQLVNSVLALATIWLGGLSVLYGVDSPVYGSASVPAIPALDSNLRFMGGLGVGLGLALLWITPGIERHGSVFRIIWLCALLGGIGRLLSAGVSGLPPMPMMVFAAVEVAGVPALIYWQTRVADRSGRRR